MQVYSARSLEATTPRFNSDEARRLEAVERCRSLEAAPREAFDRITALVKTIFNAPMVAISIVENERQWFLSQQNVPVSETPRDQAFCDHTIRSRAVLEVSDATQDGRFAENGLVTGPLGLRSYLGAPLVTTDGHSIGAICVLDTVPRRFTPAEHDILERFGAIVMSELELRQIANRDTLTGVMSRRAFEEAAHKEFMRHKRYGIPLSLALFDLDHFKSINDRFGHGVGDAVLKTAAAACSAVTREPDFLARVGGEEFALLIVGAAGADALRCAERLRGRVEAAQIAGRPGLDFTASFGVATCDETFSTLDEWMAAADAALYEAKAHGRNCCRLHMPGAAQVMKEAS